MLKRTISLFLIGVMCTMLTGCNNSLSKQVDVMVNELSKKPADKYDEHFEKNGVYVYADKMEKKELKKYYDQTDSRFHDVYFVAITNKSDKNVICSVPDTTVTTKKGVDKVIGNDLRKLLKKGNKQVLSRLASWTGKLALTVGTFGLALPALIFEGERNSRQKKREVYYITTYEKGLQSQVIRPYETAVGFLVVPDMPFSSYETFNLKFQKTKQLEYFDIEYPFYYADGKYRKQKQKDALEAADLKRKEVKAKLKEAEQKRKEELKLMKEKHKNL